ncbi:MAG TPA: MOSC N-terminal beta barrel domain-containing protein [Longimicrobiaceae bacterium]
MQGTIGTVASLWRYPVKSMQGEALDAAVLTGRGIAGDRAYALLDRETGLVASAKHPRKWERLFRCSAVCGEAPRPGAPPPPVRITLPDGDAVESTDPEVDRVLSLALGREVTLTTTAPTRPMREADRTPVDAAGSGEVINQEEMALAAPPGTFFDYGVLHLLTTGTLERLRELYPGGRFDARRFRPNLLVATAGGAEFPEVGWLGRRLRVGADVRLDAIDPAPRCVVTTLPLGGLPRDPEILRTLACHSRAASATLAPGVVFPAVAGIYASVLAEGEVRRGDPLAIG